MIQWEECSLNDATHVEINGEVHEIKSNGTRKIVKSGLPYVGGIYTCIDISFGESYWSEIAEELFPFLGIKCLRKFKPTPIEFEATFAKYDGKWHPLYSLDDGLSYQNCKKAKFKCVEILEEN
jgi:hypothetical protein